MFYRSYLPLWPANGSPFMQSSMKVAYIPPVICSKLLNFLSFPFCYCTGYHFHHYKGNNSWERYKTWFYNQIKNVQKVHSSLFLKFNIWPTWPLLYNVDMLIYLEFVYYGRHGKNYKSIANTSFFCCWILGKVKLDSVQKKNPFLHPRMSNKINISLWGLNQ